MATTIKNKKEIRTAFTNYLLGNTSAMEVRTLGVDVNNGKATIPKSIAEEIISYVEQENLLRKYGTVVTVNGNLGYPVLTDDAKNEGSLINKTKVFTPTQTEPVAIIKELKNKPSTSERIKRDGL